MSETFPINQEQFETWLRRVASRTPGIMLNYFDNCGCVVARGLRALTGQNWDAGGSSVTNSDTFLVIDLPVWADRAANVLRVLQIERSPRWAGMNDRVKVSILDVWLRYASNHGLDPALEPVDITAGMGDVAGVPEPEGVR